MGARCWGLAGRLREAVFGGGGLGWRARKASRLDSLALEGGLLAGEGALGLDRGRGRSGLGFGAVLGLGLGERSLQLLRLGAQSADLCTAGFGDEITHKEILS